MPIPSFYTGFSESKSSPVIDNNNSEQQRHFFQPKLTINQPNDAYELEADAMADKVMRMPGPALQQNTFFKPAITPVQRKCAACEEEEKAQRKETGSEVPVANASTADYIGSLNGKGRTLTQDERSFFEPRFGQDFSGVQLHTDAEANRSAKEINALAYTHENNIVFGANQYQPNTDTGKRLLAHELTHVAQQTGTVQRKTTCSYETFEHEITGVGAAIKYLKAKPDAAADNFPGEAVADGDAVELKNEGGALTYNNVKNCTWAWIEIPGKKSTDKSYPVLHGFIETKHLKSKPAPGPVTPTPPAAPTPSEKMSLIDGPEIIYPGGNFEFTAHVLMPLMPPVDFSDLKWAFKYDDGSINTFNTSQGLTLDEDTATLNVSIPGDKKADTITIYAYTTTPENGASKEVILQPVSIVESKKDKGKKEDGSVADDMLAGDMTPDQIKEIKLAFREDYFIGYTDEELFDSLKFMASTLFSTGDLETNAIAMIDHFKGNSGSDYSNENLTKAVEEHEATKKFITHVKMELSKKVVAEGESLQQTAVTKGALEKYRPVFNSTGDTFAGGLTFAINDTWAYQSEIVYYDYKSNKDFKGKLKVTLYDNFGLDTPDVEKRFGYLRGFRAWFILQHDRGYKPFITVVEMELPFDESITEIEPMIKKDEAMAEERAKLEKTFPPPRPGTRF